MSLLRLLTAGKSLVGVKDASRYHVPKEATMPKFGGKKNLFRTTTRPEPEHLMLSASRPEPVAAPASVVGPKGTQRLPVLPAAAPQENVAPSVSKPVAPASARRDGWSGKWVSKLGAWLGGAGPKPARSAIPRFNKPMVQGELSLDHIKVVRNDLSDSDLEVVRVKAPVASASAAPVLGPMMFEAAWSRVTNRLFGAGKS